LTSGLHIGVFFRSQNLNKLIVYLRIISLLKDKYLLLILIIIIIIIIIVVVTVMFLYVDVRNGKLLY
jgi:hypothetical protein